MYKEGSSESNGSINTVPCTHDVCTNTVADELVDRCTVLIRITCKMFPFPSLKVCSGSISTVASPVDIFPRVERVGFPVGSSGVY